MNVFIDTSALLSILDSAETNHARAKEIWERLVEQDERLVVHNYTLVETMALVQNRLGMEAVRAFQQDAVPLLEIAWVDEASHTAGVAALLAANRRQLSLVDCISFHMMRQLGLSTAFAFDPHFAQQGFHTIP